MSTVFSIPTELTESVRDDRTKIRDALLGQSRIKSRRRSYLPGSPYMDEVRYSFYLLNASFPPHVSILLETTVSKLLSSPPKVVIRDNETGNNINTTSDTFVAAVMKNTWLNFFSLDRFSHDALTEILTTGKAGILILPSRITQQQSINIGDRSFPIVYVIPSENIISVRYNGVGQVVHLRVNIGNYVDDEGNDFSEPRDIPNEDTITFEMDSDRLLRYTITRSNLNQLEDRVLVEETIPLHRFVQGMPFFQASKNGILTQNTQPPAYLLAITDLALTYYRVTAELHENSALLASPKLVRKSRSPKVNKNNINFKEDDIIEVQLEDDIQFLQVSPENTKELRMRVNDIKAELDQVANATMRTRSTVAESGQALAIRENNDFSFLCDIACGMNSVLERALDIVFQLMGRNYTSTVCINTEFSTGGFDVAQVNTHRGLFQAGHITAETYVYQLNQHGEYPPEIDLEAEAARVAQLPIDQNIQAVGEVTDGIEAESEEIAEEEEQAAVGSNDEN